MATFIEVIQADIDWRVSELSTLKRIPLIQKLSVSQRDLLVKYSTVAIYAIWEGFVTECFSEYAKHLNTLLISPSRASLSLLTHILDSECNFNNPRNHFEKKQKLVSQIDSLLTETLAIKTNIPTESNVNYKVLNQILERFCIDQLPIQHKDPLDKLLAFRNKIAHGENSITVKYDDIVKFTFTVESLMYDVLINIEKNEKEKTFLKDHGFLHN